MSLSLSLMLAHHEGRHVLLPDENEILQVFYGWWPSFL
jgi:hypothetical protein